MFLLAMLPYIMIYLKCFTIGIRGSQEGTTKGIGVKDEIVWEFWKNTNKF